jgi:hypothetical protein
MEKMARRDRLAQPGRVERGLLVFADTRVPLKETSP